MQGRLKTKFKVIHAIRPKLSLIPKRRIKKERDSIPQRWSRRIRSLPPIPFNVLPIGRKVKTCNSLPNKNNIKIFEKKTKSTICRIKKEKLYHKHSMSSGEEGAYEIVRIVPVVVYVKRNETKFKSLTDDLEIEVKKKNTSKASTDFKSALREKLKEECTNLEKKWSKKLKNLPLL
ncbi:uncharacterized protein LOC130897201 [Diorhabda carinulata]|uniref:uncharacterized protein LOC130897201 n=1 Tax=Diorhabda carinulata TaxID=1163345 RepID=UPI0025A11F07|nr:uncharacterized protein LOC130897201 [Diorhabda carinulata]